MVLEVRGELEVALRTSTKNVLYCVERGVMQLYAAAGWSAVELYTLSDGLFSHVTVFDLPVYVACPGYMLIGPEEGWL